MSPGFSVLALTLIVMLGILLLPGCVPEDTKPRSEAHSSR